MWSKLVLICVFAFVAFGRTDGSEITEECREQLTQQNLIRESCIKRYVSSSKFLEELNTTVVDFSGRSEDLPQVEAFFTKYCSVAPEVFQCVDARNGVTDECNAQIPDGELKALLIQAFKTLVNVGCDDDADMLKKLVPNDGFKFLILNNDFDRCVDVVKKAKSFDGVCAAIDESISCFEEVVGDHANKNIMVFVREFLDSYKSTIKCAF